MPFFPSSRLISLAVTISLLFQTSWYFAPSLAAAPLRPSATVLSIRPEVAPVLEKSIRDSIAAIYGADQVKAIYPQVMSQIRKARQQRPKALVQEDLIRKPDWYKDEVMYMLYADRFGVSNGKEYTSFKEVAGTLDYLKQLGVTTLYILPFMDSPMGDAGFDVRNFKSVREDLGGLREFQAFAQEAHKRGFKIKADLILNHISDQHAWFQSALKGDPDKLNYFVYSTKEPKYKKYRDPQKGIVVDYEEEDGQISSRSLIFPDMAKTHYREEKINGQSYYFYHSFYPFQMDINWKNPAVLYDVLDIVSFWANQGVDIFRLDAVPYLMKTKGTNAENRPETLAIIELLSAYLQATAPASVMQAEAGQKLHDLLPYFGKEQSYIFRANGKSKPMQRTSRVQIAYNFPYMSAIWATLITGEKSQFWSVAGTEPPMPPSASWATFLRVHDELTLQMVDPEPRQIIADNLEPKGAEFRKGWGVSGRMANFLDEDPVRIEQAFAIMFSLPGIPIVYYGDEIGALNDMPFAKKFAAQREAIQRQNNPNLDIISFFDSRDVNRGPVSKAELQAAASSPDTKSGAIFQAVQSMIAMRKNSPVLSRGSFTEVKTAQPSVLAYLRQYAKQKALIVNNLDKNSQEAVLTLPESTLSALPAQGMLRDIRNNADVPYVKLDSQTLQVTLQGYESVWLSL